MSNLKLNIITPIGVTYDEDVSNVLINTDDGLRSLCKNYSSTIGIVKTGVIVINNLKGEEIKKIISDGVFLISENVLKIITSFCYEKNDESLLKIESNKKKALKILNEKSKENIVFNEKINLTKLLEELKRK